jgi:DNA-binding CsgD family transcriptional regulator
VRALLTLRVSVLLLRDQPVDLTPGAGALLRSYAGEAEDTALPAVVLAWLESARASPGSPQPATVRQDGRLLIVRYLRDEGGEALLLQEVTVVPTVGGLTALGLTRREAEVVRCLARGRSNAETAAELVIAVGTVKKHLDNIYRKLGTRGRADTLASVMALMRGADTPLDVGDGDPVSALLR